MFTTEDSVTEQRVKGFALSKARNSFNAKEQDRRNYIGGSDIAVIMNMSRWKTPLKLWLEKTGQIEPDDLTSVEAVQLGTELEEFVAQKFAKETGKKVRKQKKMYVHKDYPYMAAHIDRLITGTDEILECKTCSAHKEDEWAEITVEEEINGKKETVEKYKIPQEYVLQVIWYLGITGKTVGNIAVLIGGQKFKKRKLLFDKDLFDIMVDMAKDFWYAVQNNIPPAVSSGDNSLLSKMFPSHNQDYIEKQDFENKICKLQQVKEDISALTEEKETLEAEIKKAVGENLGIITERYKVTWKEQSQSSVNVAQLKSDGLYNKYSNKNSIRKLYIREIKDAA